MNNDKIINKLKKYWNHVYIWIDKPNVIYENHKHPYDTKIIIVKGEMNLVIDKKKHHLKSGDETIIKNNEDHQAEIGENGCEYIVAEQKK